MNDIRYYDLNFNLLHTEPHYSSLNYTEKLNGVGSLEIHLPPKSFVPPLPFAAASGTFCGIVTGLRCTEKETALHGRSMNFLLTRRICPQTNITEGGGNAVMLTLVNTYLSDFAEFSAGEDFTPAPVQTADSPQTLEDVIAALCEGGGHRLVFDIPQKKFRLCFVPRRANPVIISESRGNAAAVSETLNLADFANFAKFSDSVLTTSDAAGAYRWETSVSADSEDAAQRELEKKQARTEISVTLKNLEYGKDYFLGDVLTVIRGGVSYNMLLDEISVDIDSGGIRCEPHFSQQS